MQVVPDTNRPKKMIVTDCSLDRLEEIRRVHGSLDSNVSVEYHHTPTPQDNDALINSIRPHSLVVNATGLGKDGPGSPITGSALFPKYGFAWDFNYRGDLEFLDQARNQGESSSLTIEDGWVYFLHGWTRVIAEVFSIDIPTSGSQFDELSWLAASTRN
jgi:shikimate 5-dehydrogenase